MLVEIGALVEKNSGQQILQTVKDADGVVCITLETGRSSDLISKRQFGDFGERINDSKGRTCENQCLQIQTH